MVISEDRKVIQVDKGKVLRRKSDGFIIGDEYMPIELGLSYYINGIKLDIPREEIPEDFEEIEEEIEDEQEI